MRAGFAIRTPKLSALSNNFLRLRDINLTYFSRTDGYNKAASSFFYTNSENEDSSEAMIFLIQHG